MGVCIILNPNAGSARDVDAIEASALRLGETTFCTTDQPGEATRLAQRAIADGCDLLVAAGGDGTINEVLNGLAPDFTRARLGILPLGTGNDFVRSMGIPTELDAALDVLAAGTERSIDVVRVTSDRTRYFINVSAGGFSGLVDEKLTGGLKQSWGPLAYLRSAVEALPDLSNYRTTIAFDDEEPHEINVYNVVVANARYVAGGIPIAPQAEPDDGLLDVMLVPVASMAQLALLVPQIMLGQHTDSELLVFRRARKLRIDSRPRMWFNADGELISNEPAMFSVLPRALRVIVP